MNPSPSPQVRIVTDSACDLPPSLADDLGIEIVPLTVRIGDEEFVDRHDLTPAEFWARSAAAVDIPSTAAPSPDRFEAVYRRLAVEGATAIVVVSLSGELSATVRSAELAARAVIADIAVTVVDSRTCSLGLGMIVADCARLARGGADAATVAGRARDLVRRTHVWGALDRLDHLRKGGRIGGAGALLASTGSIKPIVEVRDGAVEQGGTQRTRAKALTALVDRLASVESVDRLAVLHADCSDVDEFVEMLRPHHAGEIVVGDIGPVVGAHVGRGTIGVAFHTRR